MPLFVNPFRKHDASEFPGVLIPLRRVRRPVPEDAEDATAVNADGVATGSEEEALLPSDEITVDDLKSQFEKELASSETAYDRGFDPTPFGKQLLLNIPKFLRQVSNHQQGHPRCWHGSVSVGAVRSLRYGLVSGQVSFGSATFRRHRN